MLGVCYRRASPVFGSDINARLRELLVELKDDRVLLMGDFNYPGVDWMSGECKGASLEGIMFVECLEDNFDEQYVKEPTRGWGNILDLAITNEQGLMGDVCLDAGLDSSDHGMVRWGIYVGSERREEKGSLWTINVQIMRG